jgi:ubiquinone biosynthesis O-methyltransferase
MTEEKYIYEGKVRTKKEIEQDIINIQNLERVKELIKQVPENKNVLDMGCGIGVITRLVAEKSQKVLGIDIIEDNIKLCEEFNQKSNVQFLYASAESIIANCDDRFGCIILGEVIEHVDNPFSVLCDCYSLLENDGVLLLSTPDATSLVNILLNWIKGVKGLEEEIRGVGTEVDHIFIFDSRTITRLLNKTGFKVLSIKKVAMSLLVRCKKLT